MKPQQKSSKNEKYSTPLGLTALNGDPVMCVIIFSRNQETHLYECRMDVFLETEGDMGDDDYFERNSGPAKRYPGGLTYSFQGKDVPCLTRWIKKGSITS